MKWHAFDGEVDWYDDTTVVRCPCGDQVSLVLGAGNCGCDTCGREYREIRSGVETRGAGNGATYRAEHGFSSIYMVRIG